MTANQKQPMDTFNLPPRYLKRCWELPLQMWIKFWVGFDFGDNAFKYFFQLNCFYVSKLTNSGVVIFI